MHTTLPTEVGSRMALGRKVTLSGSATPASARHRQGRQAQAGTDEKMCLSKSAQAQSLPKAPCSVPRPGRKVL